jgi:hypothetical protein
VSNAENLARIAAALTADTSLNLTGTTTPALNDNSKKLATTEFLLNAFSGAGKQSKLVNGYQVLPGGLILQWGTQNGINSTAGTSISFNMVFPNVCFVVLATHMSPGAPPATRNVEVVIRAASYFDAYGNTAGNAIYWFAIGH